MGLHGRAGNVEATRPDERLVMHDLAESARPPEDGGLVSDNLVYRYNPLASADGLSGKEGTFNICTF
jgi:hypothetical protein